MIRRLSEVLVRGSSADCQSYFDLWGYSDTGGRGGWSTRVTLTPGITLTVRSVRATLDSKEYPGILSIPRSEGLVLWTFPGYS